MPKAYRHFELFAPFSSLDLRRYGSKVFTMLIRDADYGRFNWYSMSETFAYAMKYFNWILVQSLKLKSLSIVSQKYCIDYMNI